MIWIAVNQLFISPRMVPLGLPLLGAAELFLAGLVQVARSAPGAKEFGWLFAVNAQMGGLQSIPPSA